MALSPTSSHGGASAVAPLVLTAPTAADLPLSVVGAAAQTEDLFDVSSSTTRVLRVEPTTGVEVIADSVMAPNGGPFFNVKDGTGAATPDTWIAQMQAALGATRWKVSGHMYITAHAAPADASISTGELAFWFDQTNGAAKLMLKGKQADGTVVAASVALA